MKHISLFLIIFLFSCTEPPKKIGSKIQKKLEENRQKFETKLQRGSAKQQNTKKSNLEDIFAYKLPAHWQRQSSTKFRLLNFTTGKTSEVYLNFSQGSSGGLLANINRWRQQVGLNKITEKDIVKTSKVINFFNRPAIYVDISGDFQSMVGGKKKDWRLLGVLSINEKFSFFLKMTGQNDEVAKEKENFESFCRSFSVKEQIQN